MGMFDSFYDEGGREWQTKAFDRNLDEWHVGDPFPADGPGSFQVEVLGDGPNRDDFRDSFATIRSGRVEGVDVPRDTALPLVRFGGGLKPPERDAIP